MQVAKFSSAFPSPGKTADTAPLGAKLLCVLQTFPILLVGFRMMQAYLYALWPALTNGEPLSTVLRVTVLSVLLTLLLVSIVAATYGLWVVKPWGWMLSLLLYGLDVLFSLVLFNIGTVVVGVCVLFYLWLARDVYGFGDL